MFCFGSVVSPYFLPLCSTSIPHSTLPNSRVALFWFRFGFAFYGIELRLHSASHLPEISDGFLLVPVSFCICLVWAPPAFRRAFTTFQDGCVLALRMVSFWLRASPFFYTCSLADGSVFVQSFFLLIIGRALICWLSRGCFFSTVQNCLHIFQVARHEFVLFVRWHVCCFCVFEISCRVMSARIVCSFR